MKSLFDCLVGIVAPVFVVAWAMLIGFWLFTEVSPLFDAVTQMIVDDERAKSEAARWSAYWDRMDPELRSTITATRFASLDESVD